MRYRTPSFNHDISSSVWDYVSKRFTFGRQRGCTSGVGFHQDDGDRVDPSPRDHQSCTCAKFILSEGDRKAYLMTHGFIRRSQSLAISGSGRTAWTHGDHSISIRGPRFAPIFISLWRRVELSGASDLHRMGNAWSSLARQIFIKLRSSSDGGKIKTGSRRDRGSIAGRSWPRSSTIMGSFIAESTSQPFQLNRTAAIEV